MRLAFHAVVGAARTVYLGLSVDQAVAVAPAGGVVAVLAAGWSTLLPEVRPANNGIKPIITSAPSAVSASAPSARLAWLKYANAGSGSVFMA